MSATTADLERRWLAAMTARSDHPVALCHVCQTGKCDVYWRIYQRHLETERRNAFKDDAEDEAREQHRCMDCAEWSWGCDTFREVFTEIMNAKLAEEDAR